MPPQIPIIPSIPGQEESIDFEALRRELRRRGIFGVPSKTSTQTKVPIPGAPGQGTDPMLDPNRVPVFPDPRNQPSSTSISPTGSTPQFDRRGIEKMYEMMNTVPQVQNYKPGKMRKIGAFIIGTGDPQAGINFRDAPYLEAMHDWEAKYKPVHDIATLERYANAVEAQRAGNVLRSEDKEKDRISREGLQRAKNMVKFQDRETGNLVFVDPQSGQLVDTGRQLASYTDAEKRANGLEDYKIKTLLRGDMEKELLGMRQRGDLEAENNRQRNRESLEDIRQKNRLAIRAATNMNGVPIEQQSQLKIRFQNNAQSYFNANPGDKDWIDEDASIQEGYPVIKSVDDMTNGWFSSLYRGKSDTNALTQKRQQIYDAVYGNGQAQPLRTVPNTGTQSMPLVRNPNERDVTPDMIDMINPDDKQTYKISPAMRPVLEKQGWKVK